MAAIPVRTQGWLHLETSVKGDRVHGECGGADAAGRVAYLASGSAFQASDRPVTVVETHTSWIFMGRRRVLKMKKPIHLPFLDFTSMASRRRNAIVETQLNRRLAPDVYHDPVALRVSSSGQLTLSDHGDIIDWLVDMRRLPHADMLDERIRAHRLSPKDVEELAQRLANFYGSLTSPVDRALYLRHLEVEHSVNQRVLSDRRLGLDHARLMPLLDSFGKLFARLRPEIETRIGQGRIVEGHGDLRPCHVCLVRPPVVFDCLEFDRSMRLIDPLDELTFLGLECAILGARWVRELLCHQVLNALGDIPPPQLSRVYGAFRMLLRARLCAAHLLEDSERDHLRWLRLTRRYLTAARDEIKAADVSGAEAIRRRGVS